MIETQSYSEFSKRMSRRAATSRAPLSATFEVTRRCPLSCKHCYNNLPISDSRARARELTLSEHCGLLDQLSDMGGLWLLYTGGEIFGRPDFMSIYARAKSLGFFITLFTNATLVSDSIADALADAPPFAIEVTLYGATQATYEAMTGIPGSFRQCLRGISLLRERKLPLKLKTVATRITRHEIGQMKALAHEMGVEFKFDAMINPRIDCSASPLAVRLSPEEIVSLDLEDEERMEGWRLLQQRFAKFPPESQRPNTLYQCGGALTSFAVNPYGQMSVCVLSQVDLYDLRQGSLKEGWNKFLLEVRQRRPSRPTKCTGCGLKSMCGMCPANGELENGDPESPVNFLCEVAHLRAHAFGFDIPPHEGCELCEDGERREQLLESARRLRMAQGQAAPVSRTAVTLPLAGGCSGGCDACAVRG